MKTDEEDPYSIYFSNLSEDVWSFVSELGDKKESEIIENKLLAERDIFNLVGNNRATVILPCTLDTAFLEYFHTNFDTQNLQIITTPQHSGELCIDILKDSQLLGQLEALIRSQKRVRFLSYTASYQFRELLKYFRNLGLDIMTPQSPNFDSFWTTNFFGSKVGIRQIVGDKMAKGFITTGIFDAANLAASIYLRTNGVVLKTHKGHSGAGLLLFRPDELPKDFGQVFSTIFAKLKQDAYWPKFPIVVEEYVLVDETKAGGSPSVEFLVTDEGIEYLYYCGMRVTTNGVFKGMEVGQDVLDSATVSYMQNVGQSIGKVYFENGYRGFFDVDFAIKKNGEIKVTESNVRRTGGTHVYHLARYLFTPQFMDRVFTLSNNMYELPKKSSRSFKELQSLLTPLLFTPSTGEGIVITSASMLPTHFGYVLFGKNKDRATEIEAQMEQLLS